MNINNLLCSMRNNHVSPTRASDIAEAIPGDITRFHCEGDKPTSKNGWLYIHPDNSGATFAHWSDGIKHHYFDDANAERMPQHVMNRLRAEIKTAAEAERAKRYYDAALHAQHLWKKSQLASASHPYLVEKEISSVSARQYGGELLIPLYGPDGYITSLQRINPKGEKRFLSGGKTKGSVCWLDKPTNGYDGQLLIVEGYATGVSLHQVTHLPVTVSFSANNLLDAVNHAKGLYPSAHIVICADNDHKTPGNPGLTAAKRAASLTKSGLIYPPALEGVTDFNDLAIKYGSDELLEQLTEIKEGK